MGNARVECMVGQEQVENLHAMATPLKEVTVTDVSLDKDKIMFPVRNYH